MTSSKKIAVLAAFHETNTFCPIPTELANFAQRWFVGDEIIDTHDGTRTVLGGFIDGSRAAGMTLVPLFGAYATPLGTVTAEAFRAICSGLESQLAECEDVDGILFELHGDFVAEGVDDAEEEFVAIVRRRFPTQPIAVVLDMHANMSRARLRDVDIVVGYRTNPHVDTYDRGLEATQLLNEVLDGTLVPYRAHRGLAVVAAPPSQRTDSEPMKSLWAAADRLERELELSNVTIHGGYAYADTEYTGLGFSATADAAKSALAERAVEELLELASSAVSSFRTDYPTAAGATTDAVRGPAPVVIADTGDNINGGTPGDTTWLLREALSHPYQRFLGTVADPASLALIQAAGEGASVTLALGGTASPRSGGALEVTVEVIRITDGVFINTGPMETGATLSMNGAALIRFANCDVVVQGVPVQPNDTALFISTGAKPEDYDVLLLKGAAALRAAWSSIGRRFIDAGTPGETDSVVSRLNYARAALLES